MDSIQDKATGRHLDIVRLEAVLSQSSWLKPIGFEQVGSTNDEVFKAFEGINFQQGLVVVANEQTLGRGRLDRKWSTPAGSGIAMSIAVPKQDFAMELSAVPLVCGVAVIKALSNFAIPAALKWPNDIVFVEPKKDRPSLRKAGGILVQLINDKLIIGIGLNVDLDETDLPVENATSLSIEGFSVDRIDLIFRILEELNSLRSDKEKWLEDYKTYCSTLLKQIRVIDSQNTEITGIAVDVLENGALQVKNLENLYQITVGDIEQFEVIAD